MVSQGRAGGLFVPVKAKVLKSCMCMTEQVRTAVCDHSVLRRYGLLKGDRQKSGRRQSEPAKEIPRRPMEKVAEPLVSERQRHC